MGLDLTIKKRAIVISIALVSFLLGGALCSYAKNHTSPIVWLEFKLPPHYSKERKQIMEVTRKKYPDDLKRWSKIKNFNFDAMAVADLDEDGKPDVAFVLIAVEKHDNGSIDERYAFYEKPKGKWLFRSEGTSTGDIYYVRNEEGQLRFVSDGCVWGYCVDEEDIGCSLIRIPRGTYPVPEDIYYAGPYKNRTREGAWLPYLPYEPNNKIVSIVEKELKPEITQENQKYKKNYGVKPVGAPSIAGVFEDVNGDGKADIIVRMNEIDTAPEGENPLPPFCDESGCDYYLLLNKGNDRWQKELLGRTPCVALSKPDKDGIRQLYTNQATFVWDGASYKKVPYKPNWMVKDPIEATPEPASSVIWLDFKLPPHYEKERREIMEITRQKYPAELKKWSQVKNFNFDALAVADLDGDGKPDIAFVVLQVTEFDSGFINAILARYEKRKGEWILFGNETSTGDIYYFRNKKGEFRLVIDGCVMEDPLDYYFGPYKSSARDGIWLPNFLSGRREKITTIVNEELKHEIEIEDEAYRESSDREPPPDALIFAAFEDVNGDGKPDIIARMNGFKVGPGFRPDFPFCDNDKCDYYLLLNKGHDQWQKELLGRTGCIGLSKPDRNGAVQLYTDQATFLWDGAAYKKIVYKPNWMIKEPVKPEEGL